MKQRRIALTSHAILFIMLSVGLSVFGNATASAACPGLDTSRGVVTGTVTVPSTATYHVWSRLKAPDSTNNSYWLQIDNSTCGVVVGDSASIPAGSWTWVNYRDGNTANRLTVSLTAGSHSVQMIGREDNVQLDRLIFTQDGNCTPAGTGDNCATATSSGGGTPTGGSTSAGTTGTSGGTAAPTGSGNSGSVTSGSSSAPTAPAEKVVNGSTVPAAVPDSAAPSVAAARNISSPASAWKALVQISGDTARHPGTLLQVVRYSTAGKIAAGVLLAAVLAGLGYILFKRGLFDRLLRRQHMQFPAAEHVISPENETHDRTN